MGKTNKATANEALAYVRKKLEEFRPDTAKLLLGALRQRVPEPARRQLSDVGALALRAETAEAALQAVSLELKGKPVGPGVVEAARVLIRKVQEARPLQRYDEALKWHDVRMAIDDLELVMYKEEHKEE
jgi:hypothetical protein